MLRGRARCANLNWPNPDEHRSDALASYRPIGLVAARLLARRWPLYLATAIAVFALQALFHELVHARLSDVYASLVAPPLVIVVVTVFAGSDARDVLPSASERWARVVERAWTVILVDVLLSFVFSVGLASMQSAAILDIAAGTLVLFLAAMLVYAEPYLCIDDRVAALKWPDALAVVPQAILRSMMLSWVNMSRILLLFMILLAVSVARIYFDIALARWPGSETLGDMAFSTLANVPLAVLFAVAYLDTLSQERKMMGG